MTQTGARPPAPQPQRRGQRSRILSHPFIRTLDCCCLERKRMSLNRSPCHVWTQGSFANNSLESLLPCELFQMSCPQVFKLTQSHLPPPLQEPPRDSLYLAHSGAGIGLELLPKDLFGGVASTLDELSARCNHLGDFPQDWRCVQS